MSERIGDWIQTYSGVEFYPCDPRPDEVRLVDIAHALSNQCRFTGHCRRFYSVAEHCVYVSRLTPEAPLWGLMHDAAEAYVCDLSRPIKKHSDLGREYSLIEAKLQHVIAQAFDLPVNAPACVEVADNRMLYVEAKALMGPLGPGWNKWSARINGKEPQPACHLPDAAKQLFLERFAEIVEEWA